jgi:hypothetical protein
MTRNRSRHRGAIQWAIPFELFASTPASEAQWLPQQSGTVASLRGLCVVGSRQETNWSIVVQAPRLHVPQCRRDGCIKKAFRAAYSFTSPW